MCFEKICVVFELIVIYGNSKYARMVYCNMIFKNITFTELELLLFHFRQTNLYTFSVIFVFNILALTNVWGHGIIKEGNNG